MNEMIERVARAIARAIDDERYWNSPGIRKAARDAIEAMREPSEAMVDAAVTDLNRALFVTDPDTDNVIHRNDARLAFMSALDAALSHTPATDEEVTK